MEITLQYFDGCPNWKTTDTYLTTLISDRGLDTTLGYQLIDTSKAAIEHQFRGSPTVLIDGVDPFADSNTPIGLACRIYQTEQGPAGSPTLEQLEQAVASAAERAWPGVVTAIDRSELLRLVENEDAQVVDVLPEREYTEAHIPDAISIPLRQLTSDTASVLSRDKPVVVYWHDGLWDMSPRAACRLERLGFEKVFDYVAGIADWKASGLPTEGTAAAVQRVADATRPDMPTSTPTEQLGDVRSRTRDAGWDECIVIDCDGLVVGRLRNQAWEAEDDTAVENVMEPGPTTVRPDGILQPLVDRMTKRGTTLVIVTTPQGGLIGVLLREEAERLLTGEPPEQVWLDCEGCPGRWAVKA